MKQQGDVVMSKPGGGAIEGGHVTSAEMKAAGFSWKQGWHKATPGQMAMWKASERQGNVILKLGKNENGLQSVHVTLTRAGLRYVQNMHNPYK